MSHKIGTELKALFQSDLSNKEESASDPLGEGLPHKYITRCSALKDSRMKRKSFEDCQIPPAQLPGK